VTDLQRGVVGRLTAEQAASGLIEDTGVWVHLRGPPATMTAPAKGFQQLGIPTGRIRWEQFTVR